jgi:hypothetical protein
MTTGFRAEQVIYAPVRGCPSCGQRAVRYPVESIRLEPPVAVKPAYAVAQELRCLHCAQRCIRFRVATVNAGAVTEFWKASYFYGEAAEPPDPVLTFVLRQDGFPALPRAWSLEELHTAAGLVHRHTFPAQPLDPNKRLRETGQKRLAMLWPLAVTFWEMPLGKPLDAARTLAASAPAPRRDSNPVR